MKKLQEPFFVLLLTGFVLCLMSAYYFGRRSAEAGIYIRAENSPAGSEPASVDAEDDLALYFEPEEESGEDEGHSAEALININTASQEELETLPGIGPAAALKIIEYRTLYGDFLTAEEIKAVDGIGDGTYQKIKSLISVG